MQDIGTTLQQILLWIKQTKLQYVFTDQMFPNMFTLFVSSFPYSILLLFHIQISTPDICHCINFFNIPRQHMKTSAGWSILFICTCWHQNYHFTANVMDIAFIQARDKNIIEINTHLT